jgi:Tol biopolymer transport system component
MKFAKVYGIVLIVIVLIAWFLCNPAFQSLPLSVGTNFPTPSSTLPATSAIAAAASPSLLLFSVNGPTAGLYEIDSDGSNLKKVIANGFAPNWSPDGKRFVYSVELAGKSHLYLAQADGSDVMQLTHGSLSEDFPIWLPDGETIAFRSTDGKGLWWWRAIHSDGSGLTDLTAPSYDFFYQTLAWSRDGQWIASMSVTEQQKRHDGSSQIHVAHADGSDEFALTGNLWANINPCWSPDATQLAFLSEMDGTYGKYSLYVIGRDGSGLYRLLDNTHFLDADTRLSWAPDGQFIAYNSSMLEARINVIDVLTGEVRVLVDLPAALGPGNIPGPPAWQP